jgi:hypothetical protein
MRPAFVWSVIIAVFVVAYFVGPFVSCRDWSGERFACTMRRAF